MAVTKFEYTITEIYTANCEGDCVERLRTILNDFGNNGWELVSSFQRHAEPQWHYILILKRQKK